MTLVPELLRVSATLFSGSGTASALIYAIIVRLPSDQSAGGWLSVLHALAYAAFLLLVSSFFGLLALFVSKSARRRGLTYWIVLQVTPLLAGICLLGAGIFLLFIATGG